ncbi:site-specific integrase [Paraburkholderia sediminicola]|uniref:hypothetical protein n=1 Tax=Paraburkholderia sediminicola TaxID=458836 RepID=UPI0038B75BEF
MIDDNGTVNAPLSIYLNEKFDNPHTREAASIGLRLFHRFLRAHRVDLATRALDGECLRSVECKWLIEIAYRPIEEAERMSDKMIERLAVASSELPAGDIKGAVEPNTAAKRLEAIANFLQWYHRSLLDEAIRSPATRGELKDRYAITCDFLKTQIGGTKQGHHHNIRSLPTARYFQIIRELIVYPERLFYTTSRGTSVTLMRDRAIALLAAEGIRPGAIGNLTVDDFRFETGESYGYMVIKDNVVKRGSPPTARTPKAKGTRSIKQNYNREITVRLWPFTCRAIKDYLNIERKEILARRLANRSKSFLFLAEHGGPIGDRSTITGLFHRLGKRLLDLGLLDIAGQDPFVRGKHYDFSAYTLRHSAATFFYATNARESDVKDQMRQRFGWTRNSTSHDRYANRSISEAASVDMHEFHEELLRLLSAKRQTQTVSVHTTNRS